VLFVFFYKILGWAEQELKKHRQHLHDLVEERTIEITTANNELKKSREELMDLSSHLQSVREDERTNVAREVHDELGQILTGLQIDFSNMILELPQDKSKLIKRSEKMTELIDQSIQTVQRISEELRPSLLDKLGIIPTIEWHVEEFQNRTGLNCEVTFNTDNVDLDKDPSITIFRILQETLTNVARHANATLVKITLKKENGCLILEIMDDGKGITKEDISSPKSFGILGMRERAHFVGGEFKINGTKGKGTTTTVTVPFS
jgi:signal transduction histidine kinase